jgi:nitrite reductase/ring-hydroxylating ferredoxin subunit
MVARVEELAHGTTKKFRLRCRGSPIEGFLVGYEGKIFAYVNRCCHIAISMDWVDNSFFTLDNRYLICANHGAIFEPTTGKCIGGPCAGAHLQSVPLEFEGRGIIAFCPYD